MESIKTLIFDVSGVLVNDLLTAYRANNITYAYYGFRPFLSIEEYRERMRLPIVEFHRSRGIPEDLFCDFEKTWRRFYSMYVHLSTIIPEVREVLPKLKQSGVNLGVCSNLPNKSLSQQFLQFGILDYFDAITGRDDYDEEKPSPKPVLTALKKLNASPRVAAFVGDMEEDILAGKRAGVYTIAVDRKEAYHPVWRLAKHNPDYIINNLNDLLDIV